MPHKQEQRSLIFCPRCDAVLEWERCEDGSRRFTIDSWAHLEGRHKYRGARTLREPYGTLALF